MTPPDKIEDDPDVWRSAQTIIQGCLGVEEAGETHADRDYRRQKLRDYGARPYPMPYVRHGELGRELRKFQSWVIQRVDLHTSWKDYWEKAGGEVRKLGPRRVSLPLFGEGES